MEIKLKTTIISNIKLLTKSFHFFKTFTFFCRVLGHYKVIYIEIKGKKRKDCGERRAREEAVHGIGKAKIAHLMLWLVPVYPYHTNFYLNRLYLPMILAFLPSRGKKKQ